MLLELKNILKVYETAGGTGPRQVLNNLSFEVSRGQSVAIVGPSGSGKSTLLNIIGCLDKPTSGDIYFDGQDLSTCTNEDLALIRSQKIGFVFQQHHLLPQCTVMENVLLPTLAHPAGTDKALMLRRAEELIAKVGLTGHRDQRPVHLSGGEKQRVAVVRALINQPRLILADEPTGSLDQKTADQLAALLVKLNKEEGVTLIVVTHASKLAGQMQFKYGLNDGKLDPYQE